MTKPTVDVQSSHWWVSAAPLVRTHWSAMQRYFAPKRKDESRQTTVKKMDVIRKNFLSGTWEDFESWIEAKVGGVFTWKVKPMDTKLNRMVVAKSIIDTLQQYGGRFPASGNTVIGLEKDDQYS